MPDAAAEEADLLAATALPPADKRRTSSVDDEVLDAVESVERATVTRPADRFVDDADIGAGCDARLAGTVAVLGAAERRIADTPAPTPRPERPASAAGTDDTPPKRDRPPPRPRRTGEATDRSNDPPISCTPPADEPAVNIEPEPNNEPLAADDPSRVAATVDDDGPLDADGPLDTDEPFDDDGPLDTDEPFDDDGPLATARCTTTPATPPPTAGEAATVPEFAPARAVDDPAAAAPIALGEPPAGTDPIEAIDVARRAGATTDRCSPIPIA